MKLPNLDATIDLNGVGTVVSLDDNRHTIRYVSGHEPVAAIDVINAMHSARVHARDLLDAADRMQHLIEQLPDNR